MPPVNRLDLQVHLANSPTMASPVSGGPSQVIDFFHTFTEGLNPGQVNQVYYGQRTLGVSATEDLDISGTLKEVDGVTNVTLVRLRVVGIYNEGPGDLTFARAAANGVPLFSAASDAIVIPAGGMFFWTCGATASGTVVTAATGDLLTVTETSALGTTYDVMIAGT